MASARLHSRLVVTFAVAVMSLAIAASAHAAQVTVTTTTDSSFSPARVTIAPGDGVAWRNGGGEHNVHFDDGSFEFPAAPSSIAWSSPVHTFPAPGRVRFHCELHGGPGGAGMSGIVVVSDPNAPLDVQPPTLRAAKLRARDGKLMLSFKTTEAGAATVKLQRRVRGRFKLVRTVRRKVSAGRVVVKVARDRRGRALASGRYRATVAVRDAAGNVSAAKRASARID